jgi:hypothetical protein
MSYILEIQKYDDDFVPFQERNGLFIHVGYMDKSFRTKQEACLYYDQHNSHMRSLNVNGDWISDTDSKTKLRYIVRNGYWEFFCVVPWYRPWIRIVPFPEITLVSEKKFEDV